MTSIPIPLRSPMVIPAFSLGRTQEILFVLDKLHNQGLLHDIRIFVDSPLSSKATEVVRKYAGSFNEELQAYLKKDPEPFGFPNLTYIESAEESQALNALSEPCVIIASSGMLTGGASAFYAKYLAPDERNGIFLTGYQDEESPGRVLQRWMRDKEKGESSF